MSLGTISSEKTRSGKARGLSGLLLHSFAALLIGVGIVTVFTAGLVVFDKSAEEKAPPETAYLIRFPENEDMLNRLPREIIEGTGFDNIAPAGGESSTGSDTPESLNIPALQH